MLCSWEDAKIDSRVSLFSSAPAVRGCVHFCALFAFHFEIRKSSGDLVAIQISARLKKGVPKKLITRELLEAMIRR
jgi:hypothetical protein